MSPSVGELQGAAPRGAEHSSSCCHHHASPSSPSASSTASTASSHHRLHRHPPAAAAAAEAGTPALPSSSASSSGGSATGGGGATAAGTGTRYLCTDCNMVLNSERQLAAHMEGVRHANQQAALERIAAEQGRTHVPAAVQTLAEGQAVPPPSGPRPRKPRGRRVRRVQSGCCAHGRSLETHAEHADCIAHAHPHSHPHDDPEAVTEDGYCARPICHLRRLVHEMHCGCNTQCLEELQQVSTEGDGEGARSVAEAMMDTLFCCGLDVIPVLTKLLVQLRSTVVVAEVEAAVLQHMRHTHDAACEHDDACCLEEEEMMEQQRMRDEHKGCLCAELLVEMMVKGVVPHACAADALHRLLQCGRHAARDEAPAPVRAGDDSGCGTPEDRAADEAEAALPCDLALSIACTLMDAFVKEGVTVHQRCVEAAVRAAGARYHPRGLARKLAQLVKKLDATVVAAAAEAAKQ